MKRSVDVTRELVKKSYRKFLIAKSLEELSVGHPNSYELRKLFECYLITAYPLLSSPTSVENFKKGLSDKRIKNASKIEQNFNEIINSKPNQEEKLELNIAGTLPPNESYAVYLTYGKLRFTIPAYRYKLLEKMGEPEDILLCALDYAALLPGSQQWAIPLENYTKFVNEHGATIEGFASPFNSQIIRVNPGLKYCSLFGPDKKLGSLGNFFNQDFSGKCVIVNPPFIETILEAAARKCIMDLDVSVSNRTKGTKFIFYGPGWEDSRFYEILEKSQFVTSKETLRRDNHYYEDVCSGNKIKAKFVSVIFILERV